ncbi:putative calponin-like protein [Golovinomyces cichoracearum]|uniref:Putative calponin-like protein n=1 Tax=Golovinomyces cichoracearum TaxID=62708 RepID=A0A420IFM7_9PEZI|nr:putative calponin-like protein [Golovinomyces cichoracearum]
MAPNFVSKDMRILRSERYSPIAANEARNFIEASLGEQITPGDLLDALKDGVALCKLVNHAAPDTLRFNERAHMPFVQMENISLFLEACKKHPFNLQSHDTFLTVDLYESKDPAQVLQCLGAFSRAVHKIDPVRFPYPIGSRPRMSSQETSAAEIGKNNYQERAVSTTSSASSIKYSETRSLLTKSKTGDASYGRKRSPIQASGPTNTQGLSFSTKNVNEGVKSPPWSVAQYGYMGGASQGNLGVSFGGRRQITSAGPYFTSFSEKEKKQREKDVEKEMLRFKTGETERKHKEQAVAEEEKKHSFEEKGWADKTKISRDKEFLKKKEENRRWEQRDLGWRNQEESRLKDKARSELDLNKRRNLNNSFSSRQLRDQYLIRNQVEDVSISNSYNPESNRVKELERELELAREREREYERARLAKSSRQNEKDIIKQNPVIHASEGNKDPPEPPSRSHILSPKKSGEAWNFEGKNQIRRKLLASKSTSDLQSLSSTIFSSHSPIVTPTRQIPEPVYSSQIQNQQTGSRPLPDPTKYAVASRKNFIQTDDSVIRYGLPWQSKPSKTYLSKQKSGPTTSDLVPEDWVKQKPQQSPGKKSSWAIKGLLEREMEMERQRQREWEQSQRELERNVSNTDNVVEGTDEGIGGRWDADQWASYTEDSQNIDIQGIGYSRRQIVGPRPPPTSR